jgi:uncharacterized protein
MVIDRRSFLATFAATLVVQGAGGSPAKAGNAAELYLGCRFQPDGPAFVSAFSLEGEEVFSTTLPARGHDSALHPAGQEAVVFARRPGDWFAVIHCQTGLVRQMVRAGEGRHYFGHGAYSADGRMLFATENDVLTGDGLIGLYDASDAYRRVGEYRSAGIGPHDMALLHGGSLAIANGGTLTSPDHGRLILNRETMRPNIALINPLSGLVESVHELPTALHQLSIRHFAVAPDGEIAFACQYEGQDDAAPPLVGVLSKGKMHLLDMPDEEIGSLNNYIGSLSLDSTGEVIAATAPEGSTVAFFDRPSRRYLGRRHLSDVCGVAPTGSAGAILLTSGNGGVRLADARQSALRRLTNPALDRWIWDNHLTSMGSV